LHHIFFILRKKMIHPLGNQTSLNKALLNKALLHCESLPMHNVIDRLSFYSKTHGTWFFLLNTIINKILKVLINYYSNIYKTLLKLCCVFHLFNFTI